MTVNVRDMSTVADEVTACPSVSEIERKVELVPEPEKLVKISCDVDDKRTDKKTKRKVCFPEDNQLVTQYFEPANPWHNVPPTSRSQLAAEYLEFCRHNNTTPIDSVLEQIRELPEGAIGGATRAARLTLSECELGGAACADALEAVLRRVRFRRLEIDDVHADDEAAEALFDMIEYYESATTVSISGTRHFGIRGWQAISRMIKKSAELCELEVADSPLDASHASVLTRALRPHACRLRALCLQRVQLAGEPLLCLVIALKYNNSVRELRLGDNQLTPQDAAQIASLLRINTKIQLLDLSNNQIQDAGARFIVDAIVDQSSRTPTSPGSSPQNTWSGYETFGLTFLVLWNNQLTRNSAHHLGRAVRGCQTLCVLNVGRNALGTECVRSFCSGDSVHSLHSLGLQAVRLGPDAAPALASLITKSALQRLDLRDNKLGAVGLQAILDAMKGNTTLTQIDLDDPPDSSSLTEDSEAAVVARLTREIRALCTHNEQPPGTAAVTPPQHRAIHRKISLTCHTVRANNKPAVTVTDEERRSRLRSPAPSPSPSPAPSPPPPPPQHNRFSVTPVTPEKQLLTNRSSDSNAARSVYSTPSRFKVVQVIEPPQIRVESAKEQPRRASSRFSVTRNFDTIYNPTTPSPTSPSQLTLDLEKPDVPETRIHAPETQLEATATGPVETKNDAIIFRVTGNKNEQSNVTSETIIKNVAQNNENSDIKNAIVITKDADELKNSHVFNTDNMIKNKSECEARNIISSNDSKGDEIISNSYKDKCDELTHSECVSVVDNEDVLKTETKLTKMLTQISNVDKVDVNVEVTVKTESAQNTSLPVKVHSDQNVCSEIKRTDIIVDKNKILVNSENNTMKQFETITEDLGNLLKQMKDLTIKVTSHKKDEGCNIQTDVIDVNSKLITCNNVPVNYIRDKLVLKKNKSESSLDSPDLEVSRLMNKRLITSPFCDSSSSLEISGSSMESLNDNNNQIQILKPIIVQESVESDNELDRRKFKVVLSTDDSIESNTSDVTPANSNFLNTSISSIDSVSPVLFAKKIHGSISSLETSFSSLDSKQEKMVASADSGFEHSLQNPSESKTDTLTNDGTLTSNSSLKDSVKKTEFTPQQETLTTTPKLTSSLLDVPALKNKGLDKMRKISWVAPSSSFHIPKPEPEATKLPSHLDKLLSLFHHPSSLFSRNMLQNEDEKKSASDTPPRKDSSLTSSFWTWGSSSHEKVDKGDKTDDTTSSETIDSTLSERIQVSFVDESFPKKFDSKTPSTDTDNTLSEFQSLQGNSDTDVSQTDTDKKLVTNITTDNDLVQKLDLSVRSIDNASSNGNNYLPRECDTIDLLKPNDFNRNVYNNPSIYGNKNNSDLLDLENIERNKLKILDDKLDVNAELKQPRTFAAVLKSSGSENSLYKPTSPEVGEPVDKLPNKIIRGIKENISPENTLTSSMTNTQTLVLELSEKQNKLKGNLNALWDAVQVTKQNDEKTDKVHAELAPIATIEETCDDTLDNDKIEFIDETNSSHHRITIVEKADKYMECKKTGKDDDEIVLATCLESVDLGKDALCYLMYENKDFDPESSKFMSESNTVHESLAQELKEAEIKQQLLDLSPELVVEEVKKTEVCPSFKNAIPERAKLKKSNSFENVSQSTNTEKENPTKCKTIAFQLHDNFSTPCAIPEGRSEIRTRSGSSPKSLPESLNETCPLSKMESVLSRKKKKVSSLGKMARDSLLALNMNEEEIAEFRRSYKLTSVESLRSLESVSEDAFSQSGNFIDSKCRYCLRTSQESLLSIDSTISEDCRCNDNCEAGTSNR